MLPTLTTRARSLAQRRFGGGSRQAFTLVELLIAVALGSIILMMIAKIFSGASRVFTTSGQQTQAYNGVRVVFDIMQEQLESIVPQWYDGSGPKPSVVNVLWGLKSDGTDGGVNYKLRIRYYDPNKDLSGNVTGLSIVEYSYDATNKKLMWRFHPNPAAVQPPWNFTSATNRTAIVENVSAFQVEYQNAYRNAPANWITTWPDNPEYANHLPLAVKVSIEVKGVSEGANEEPKTLRFVRVIQLPTGLIQQKP